MQRGKQLIVILLIMPFLRACQSSSSESTLHFYIGNLSRVQKQMDIQVAVGGQPLFDSAVNFAVNPYEYTTEKKLAKGSYTINVTADSGRLKLVQPVTVKDNNLWVYINYTFGSAGDTIFSKATLKNLPSLAAIDLTKPNPSLHIFVSDSKPAALKPDSSFKKWAEDTSQQ